MANGKMLLSQEGNERLDLVISHLILGDGPTQSIRPEALRIALSKGILNSKEPPEPPSKKVREIPEGIVARGEDYLLFKHLVVHNTRIPVEELDEKTIDKYLIRYIELGLEIMEREIKSLSGADNYILSLVNAIATA